MGNHALGMQEAHQCKTLPLFLPGCSLELILASCFQDAIFDWQWPGNVLMHVLAGGANHLAEPVQAAVPSAAAEPWR
jgi:hypothetical protein